MILSDAFWRSNFGADPAVINRDIIVNGAPHTVVGVLPPGVNFDYFTPEPIELYVPFPMIPLYTLRTGGVCERATGRPRLRGSRPDATIEQADAELRHHLATAPRRSPAALSPRLGRPGSRLLDGRRRRCASMVVGNGRPIVLMLFGAVGLVLLIACVNTAQFLLARAVERQPEVVIRSALGAGSGRLLRQFLTEALPAVADRRRGSDWRRPHC